MKKMIILTTVLGLFQVANAYSHFIQDPFGKSLYECRMNLIGTKIVQNFTLQLDHQIKGLLSDPQSIRTAKRFSFSMVGSKADFGSRILLPIEEALKDKVENFGGFSWQTNFNTGGTLAFSGADRISNPGMPTKRMELSAIKTLSTNAGFVGVQVVQVEQVRGNEAHVTYTQLDSNRNVSIQLNGLCN